MAYLFAVLLLVSLALLFIGLISPKTALFWKKNPATRGQAVLTYFLASIVLFVLVGVTAPHDHADATDSPSEASANPAEAVPLTEEDKQYQLATSCDTNWRWYEHPEKYLNRTGWIIDDFVDDGDWDKNPWMTTTFRQTGPETYEDIRDRKIAVDMEVQVVAIGHGNFLNYTEDFLTVTPVGSTTKYIILERNFSLRNPNACGLLQRAKNKFPTKAEYLPPADAGRRPLDDRDMTWIDAPAGSRIVVKEWNEGRQMYDGPLYDKKGGLLVPYAHFWPETVREVK